MNSIGTGQGYCYFRRRMSDLPKNPALKPTRTLVLVGMMGAGKSSVGHALAQKLGLPFADTDVEIEATTHQSIPDIFAKQGEAAFRDLEHETLKRFLLRPDAHVLATGGGAFVQPRNHDLIKQNGLSIWLKADVSLLVKRTAGNTSRPLLQGDDPAGKLTALLAAREATYSTADLIITVDDSPIAHTVKRVLSALQNHLEHTA